MALNWRSFMVGSVKYVAEWLLSEPHGTSGTDAGRLGAVAADVAYGRVYPGGHVRAQYTVYDGPGQYMMGQASNEAEASLIQRKVVPEQHH